MHCKICGFKISEFENLRVDEKISKMIEHINELATGKDSIYADKKMRKLKEKHRVALRDCISIMDLIGKEEEEI